MRTHADAWGPTWLRIRNEGGRDALRNGTLMLGSEPNYSLVKNTRMLPDSMSVMLREVIQRRRPESRPPGIFSHSMKVTFLSWAHNKDLNEDVCRVLNDHSKPKNEMPTSTYG